MTGAGDPVHPRNWHWIGSFGLIAAGFGLVAFVCFVLVGGLQEPLLAPLAQYPAVATMHYFDAQGQMLLLGRLDVPCESLQWEALRIGDKCYGYFGMTPAIMRFVLNGYFPEYAGRWPRIMMIAGGLLAYVGCVLVGCSAFAASKGWRRALWATGFALVMTLGGTLPFIVSDPYPYHEAILWASSFAVLALWAGARYAETGRGWPLRLCMIFALLTLHARITTGLAVSIALIVWFSAPFFRTQSLRRALFSPQALARPRRNAAMVVALLVVMTATPLAINQLKFGQVTPPFDHQQFFTAFPQRLSRIAGGSFRLANLRCTAQLYLSPVNIAFVDHFPWIAPGQPKYWNAGLSLPPVAAPCLDTYVESLDPSFSLVYSAPAPLLLAFIGFVLIARRRTSLHHWGPPVAGGGMIAASALIYSSVNFRYEHDFFPLLVFGGVIGWSELAALPSRWRRTVAAFGISLCTLAAFYVNFVAAQKSGSPQPYMLEMGRMVSGMFTAVP